MKKLKLSIKSKLFLLLSCIFVTSFWLIQQVVENTQYLLENMNSQKAEFYELNRLLENFAELENSIDYLLYYTNSAQERSQAWENILLVEEKLENNLNQLNYTWSAENQEIYFLNKAIKQCYTVYEQEAEFMLRIVIENADDSKKYEHDLHLGMIAEYAQQYLRQSLSISINKEQQYLEIESKNLDVVYEQITGVAFGFIFLMSFLMYLLINGILKPILNISNHAKELAKGNFNLENIEASSNDEIGQLATTFNTMKLSINNLVETLKKKNNIEKELFKSKLQIAEEQKLLEEARFKQLASQINPHFLFNTLNIISRQARIEKASQTEKLILILARIFRYSIKDDKIHNSLYDEVKIINDYMEIQYARFDEKIILKWNIEETLDLHSIYVPSFTLQPLVENAIIHGLEDCVENGLITISIFSNELLNIIIEDNGKGIPKETLNMIKDVNFSKNATNKIGIGNVIDRIKLMYSISHFKISSEPEKGTTVHIKIYLKNK